MAHALLFTKSHVSAFTRKDGTFVAAHDDKRTKAASSSGNIGDSERAQYGDYFKEGDKVKDNYGNHHEVLSHIGAEVKTKGGQSFHPTKVHRVKPTTLGDLKKHPNYAKEDFDHLKGKGYTLDEIKGLWDRDKSEGKQATSGSVKPANKKASAYDVDSLSARLKSGK